MRYGVVSDIHANIQAWKAVLRDMKNEGVDIILCLGDVVGYGPNPAEVLDSCYEHVDYFILGNHDAVIGNRLDSSLFNDNAKYLIEWTRDQLNPAACDFFSDMPLRMEGEGFVCAHGELAMPGRFGYIYEAQDAIASFTSNQSPMMFVGHTHLPAKFVLNLNDNSVRRDHPADSYLLPDERYLVNAGSVGDPRDGNVTASYCIYDTDSMMVKFRQVPFDIDAFRRNLLKAKLPVNPFFLKVHDGQKAETETIKDMKVMESNQTSEATGNSQRVIKIGEDVKTRRKKLTFSMDDVMQTKHFKTQVATRRVADAETKKKGKVVIVSLVAALMIVFGIVIVLVKSGSKGPDSSLNTVVNEAPGFIKDSVKVITQESGKDLDLTSDSARLPVDVSVDPDSGLIIGWNKQTTSLEWTAQIREKGWYEVFVDYAKSDTEAEVRLKMGFTDYEFLVPPTVEGKLEKTSFGYFQSEDTGRMNISLTALKPGPDSVAAVKALRLRFHGDKKPNPYGDQPDIVFESFDKPHFNNNWIIRGEAFPHRPISKDTVSPFFPISGVEGDYCAGSMIGAADSEAEVSAATGLMISRSFTIKHRYIQMLACGSDSPTVRVELSIKGKNDLTFKLPNSSTVGLKPFEISVIDYVGEEARLIFRDTGDKVLAFDKIVFSNNPIDILQVGTTTLEKPVPEIIDKPENAKYSGAGKLFLQGDFEGTVKALATGTVNTGSNIVDASNYEMEILKFSSMKMASNKELTQLDSGNVTANSCNDKDSITLEGKFTKKHDLMFVQLDAVSNAGKAVGLSSNGNFFLTNFVFKVTREKLLNTGRYVRISLRGDSKTLSLAEVMVMSGGNNIAKGKTATQSSMDHEGVAGLAVDGNPDGNFPNKSVTHSKVEKSPWWEVDLGKAEVIDSIKVFNRTDEDLMARLNRYSVTVLDENRRIIWQDFVHEAQQENEHKISESFQLNFDTAKASYSGKDRSPAYCLHSKDNANGWSVYPKTKEDHTAWFGMNNPLLINENDTCTVQLFFNSTNKKHVLRKFRLSVLSSDNEKQAKFESELKPFLKFQEAIIGTFREDEGKIIDYIHPVKGTDIKLKVLNVTEDGKIHILDATKRRHALGFEQIAEKEIEKRAQRLTYGALAFAHYKNRFAEKVKELEYDKETLVGKLIDAGQGRLISRFNPSVLTGRFIEIWKIENEKSPKFDIEVNSAGEKIIYTPEIVPLEQVQPEFKDTKIDVSIVDLGISRNINGLKILKKSEGKVSKYNIIIRDENKKIIWQSGFYSSELIVKDGKNFDLKSYSRYSGDLNLAAGSNIIKGAVYNNWNGLTDGILGAVAPFAYATKEGDLPREIILDLGEEKEVNAFRATKNTTSAFNGISVEYSNDNQNYIELAAVSTSNNDREVILWTISDQPVRYVKVKFINNHPQFKYDFLKAFSILSEFEVLKF